MNTTPQYSNHTVAVYESHETAEAAVRLLNSEGFDMKQLSIIGQEYHSEERPIGFVNTGDRMVSWGKFGAFWGTIWGLLFGSAFMIIPGVGPLVFAGYVVGALEGAVLGGSIGVLGGALAGVGIPPDSIVQYETDLKAGKFILLAHGDEAEAEKAKHILAETSSSRLDSFGAKGSLVGML